MTVKIGWTPYKRVSDPTNIHFQNDMEAIDMLYFEPEKLNYYKNSQSLFMKCPAVTGFHQKFFVIKSPFDLELTYDRNKQDVRISESQKFYDQFVSWRKDEYGENERPLFSFLFQYMFVADEPVWIETYPAFLHGQPENTQYIPGSFDIYNWFRPVDFSFQMIDDTKPVTIKRGQPLFYLKFNSKKLNDNFTMKRIEWTDELFKQNKRCSPHNWVRGLSWKLMLNGNPFRPKKMVK